MNLYTAIEEMRKLSREGKPFSFSFMSYSRDRQKTDGIVVVDKAVLKPRSKDHHRPFEELIEEYVDVSIKESRRFWRCTLMSFNQHTIEP